jgi:hypothetical protein
VAALIAVPVIWFVTAEGILKSDTNVVAVLTMLPKSVKLKNPAIKVIAGGVNVHANVSNKNINFVIQNSRIHYEYLRII